MARWDVSTAAGLKQFGGYAISSHGIHFWALDARFGHYLGAPIAAKELAAINAQYPFTPLKWLPETLRLTFAEGIQMLNDAGYEVIEVLLSCYILLINSIQPL